MGTKKMYFGTAQHMMWIPCPAINAGLGAKRWRSVSNFLNGGAMTRASTTAHKEYSFSWSPMSQDSAYEILDYLDGLYSDELFYFYDPFALGKNILPTWLASPNLGLEDAPTMITGKKPTPSTTLTTEWGYPPTSAQYDVTSLDAANIKNYWFPVPPGYTAHIGAHGTSSGTAKLTVLTESGSTPLTLLSTDTPTRTNFSTSGDFNMFLTGVGTIDLAGIMVQMLPTGQVPEAGKFISGRGHSGVRLSSDPAVTGYSAALSNASVGITAEFIETGAWE